MDREGLGGGFATPGAPGLMAPGGTDPRVRSFTEAVADPVLVEKYGVESVAQLGVSGLIPPPEDLDRVALFVPPPISGEWHFMTWLDTYTKYGPLPDGSAREPTWADVVTAGSDIGKPELNDLAVRSALAWWRQAYALGPLPEDSEEMDDPRSSSWNWPASTQPSWGVHQANLVRRIYFWGFGKDGRLYKHMQVQKQDTNNLWHIFNQWGQNLTFVWKPEQGIWEAGWDFGDWFTQNKAAIITGIQLAVAVAMTLVPVVGTAVSSAAALVFGVSQYGLSLGTQATFAAVASAYAAQQMFISGMVAIAKGDVGEALKYFTNMSNIVVTMVPEVKTIPAEVMQLAPMKAFATLVSRTGSTDITTLVANAQKVVKDAEGKLGGFQKIAEQQIQEARALVPAYLRPWFDDAAKKGGAALATRANTVARNLTPKWPPEAVPWYAAGIYDYGTAIGVLANPQSAGIRAPRSIPVDPWASALASVRPAVDPFHGTDPRAPLNTLVVQLKKRYGI